MLSASAETLLNGVNESYLKTAVQPRVATGPTASSSTRAPTPGRSSSAASSTIGFTTGNHPRYHLPADEARFLDPVQMQAIGRTVFASLWALADMAERPRIDRPMPPSVPRYP